MNKCVEKLPQLFLKFKSNLIHSIFGAALLLFPTLLCGQTNDFKPGFNRDEFLNIFRMSARQVDTPFVLMQTPEPHTYTMTYRSASMGMDNRWDLWEAEGLPPVISIRGSTPNQISWVENFYAAMLPAKGTVRLGNNLPVNYCFSKNADAGVHAGWLIGTVALSADIFRFMQESIAKGNKAFYLVGHSQGGAIAILLNAWIHELIEDGVFPSNLKLKTYCSAAPKPGNLQFAYDFERKNQQGWAYNVLNPEDWVPETPPSVQTQFDFSATNPFSNPKNFINGRKLHEKLAVNYLHKKLTRNARKAQRKFRKYLGHKIEKPVRKHLKGLEVLPYLETSNFMRCGTSIILQPDAGYYALYPKISNNLFIHHFHEPYRYLAERLPQFVP